MAIHNEEVKVMQGGFSKKIEASGMEMILKNLQQYQYQHPIPSTVREIASNGIDSNAEKNIAKAILFGKAKVSDFFVEKEGPEFADSKFDPDYYDLNWLSDDNSVYINYIVNGPLEKDMVIFRDNGVGLGKYRLEKYFSLSYSTKRLSKQPLGKFGIGGKAPLSVRPFYTMESRYNGQLYRFNIYSGTVDSIIPQRNMTTGEENKYVIFDEGTDHEYKVYYESTEEKNGVTVSLEALKAHKQQYIDAVKSQLLYFQIINFNIIEHGEFHFIDYRARILYEDDFIILSDNQYWSQPHLLLNKINYGYINFDELELENKRGNIGIKIAPEDVDVNPSRESIIWNDRTKQMVLECFNRVVESASRMIQEQLKDTDYIKWMKTCYALSGRMFSEGTIAGRLAKIVDLTNVKPSFLPNPKLKFDQEKLLGGLTIRQVWIERSQEGGRWNEKIKYYETRDISRIINRPIYLLELGEKMSNKKNKFLLRREQGSSIVPGQVFSIIFIAPPMDTKEEMILAGFTEEMVDNLLMWRNKNGNQGVELRRMNWEELCKSNEVRWYKDVEVPEDFTGTDEALVAEQEEEPEVEDIEEEEKDNSNHQVWINRPKQKRITAREMRKQNGMTLLFIPQSVNSRPGYSEQPADAYHMQQFNIPISDIPTWIGDEVYYSKSKDQDSLLKFVAMLTRIPSVDNKIGAPTSIPGVDKGEVMLIRPAPETRKYLRNFKPIEQFFLRVENKKVTMSNVLIKWNTSRIVKAKLHLMAYLFNWDIFNSIYAKYYKTLVNYVDANYREVEEHIKDNFVGLTKETYSDMIKHLDKVQEFQDFVSTNPPEKELAEMAQYIFGNRTLTDGQSVDPEIMIILRKLIEYTNAIGPMWNYMPILTGMANYLCPETYKKDSSFLKKPIPMDLEMQIKRYLEHNNLLDYGKEERDEQEINAFADEITSPSVSPLAMVEEEKEEGAKLFLQDGIFNQHF